MSTVAAISTPNAVGGIAVIRISGEDAFAVSDRVFKAFSGKKVSEMEGTPVPTVKFRKKVKNLMMLF